MKNISTCLFLLLLLNYVPMDASAQPSARELLRQKTNSQLREIVEQSPAITGLVALDLTSGERFEIHPDVVFPQASAIKIPILMAVYQGAQRGKYKMNDIRPVEAKTVVGGTGILKDMLDPASLTIRNLGVLMIALSDNTATNALIDLVGMPEINATLQSLGLQQTKVQRKMINSAASGRGEENLSTPAEAIKVLELLYKGEFISKATSGEILSILQKTTRETSRLAASLPEQVPIAFKPGVLNGVSTEWAIVLLPERPYAVAIMESYKIAGQSERVMEEVSGVLYEYFWRIGNASRYGVYVDPGLIK